MTKAEAIREGYENLQSVLPILYREVLESNGRIQYVVHIWDDGTVQSLEEAQGSNSWLVPKTGYDHQIYVLTTVAVPFFDFRDYVQDTIPEDEDELDKLRDETIDWLVDQYRETVPDILDTLIEEAEQD